MREIKLKEHTNVTVYQMDNAEEIIMTMFGIDSKEELQGLTINGEDFETGEEVEVSYKDVLKGIETEGCFGISHPETKTVFIWADFTKTNPVKFFNMLGHELGHLEDPQFEDEKQEEVKANIFGGVSSCAYDIYENINK